MHEITRPVLDKIRKDIIRSFRENFGVETTITVNLKTFNFLVVTFDLLTGRYQPYKKPNNTSTYINVNSNHRPPNIIKALPDSISRRTNNISSDIATFNNAARFHNGALSTNGHKEYLSYRKDLPSSNKVRQRKIIWFNPPHILEVETNIGKIL